jgi:hypothetical protein
MGFATSLPRTILIYSQFCNYYIKWAFWIIFSWLDFVTIAITLGSGILGLPVTLADSGFLPFLIPITAIYIIQVNRSILFP